MKCRATVIIPTFGDARFARWAVKSVQNQTVKQIEICIICDGSPENMVSFFKRMEDEDPRIKVYVHPKSPRTGEPYRDIVIKKTVGRIIAYCSHDDLWLPFHIAKLEKTLKHCWFAHSIHAFVNTPDAIRNNEDILGGVYWINLRDKSIVDQMFRGTNFFGLTYAAHTRGCYGRLREGWATTPVKETPTDLYMWIKFLSQFKNRCRTLMKVTALNFRTSDRLNWSEKERNDELKIFYERIQDPSFLKRIDELSRAFQTPQFLEENPGLFGRTGHLFGDWLNHFSIRTFSRRIFMRCRVAENSKSGDLSRSP